MFLSLAGTVDAVVAPPDGDQPPAVNHLRDETTIIGVLQFVFNTMFIYRKVLSTYLLDIVEVCC